jgi:hypothetical protein
MKMYASYINKNASQPCVWMKGMFCDKNFPRKVTYKYTPALKFSCAKIINHTTPPIYRKTHNLLW